jgi:hypothetical protein
VDAAISATASYPMAEEKGSVAPLRRPSFVAWEIASDESDLRDGEWKKKEDEQQKFGIEIWIWERWFSQRVQILNAPGVLDKVQN